MITLTRPPSVNHLYGLNTRGPFPVKYVTREGAKWFADSILLIRGFYKIKHKGNVAVYIKAYLCGTGDIDNLLKALLDALTKAGTIEDDKCVTFLQIEKIPVPHRKDEKIDIEIQDELIV